MEASADRLDVAQRVMGRVVDVGAMGSRAKRSESIVGATP
jgi:hypothetical protein